MLELVGTEVTLECPKQFKSAMTIRAMTIGAACAKAWPYA
jgi:hypothetical protein